MTHIPVIIKFRDRVYKDDIEFVESTGGIIKRKLPLISSISVDIPEESVSIIQSDMYVEYIEEDKKRYPLGFPSGSTQKDNIFRERRILNNVKDITKVSDIQLLAQTVPWGIDGIRAREVHALGIKGKNVRVCVIDTGIDYNHEDLRDNYVAGFSYPDYTDYTNDPFYSDNCDYMVNNHGTHVSGIVAASDNTVGVIGVAPEASIYMIRVLDIYFCDIYVSYIIEAINWAINNKMHIISISLGGDGYSQAEEEACNAAYNAGILLVAAAGNSYGGEGIDNVLYPAKFDSVVAVAAIDSSFNKADFSSTGPSIELAAPGVSVYSTVHNGYQSWSGTSMACPHVSGAAALIIQKNPTLTNVQIRDILINTATHLGTSGRNWLYGYGLIDAKNAIDNTPSLTCPITCDFITIGINRINRKITFVSKYELISYTWFIGNVPQAYTHIFTKVFTTAGIYEVKLEGTDLCGTPCVITKNITIPSLTCPTCDFITIGINIINRKITFVSKYELISYTWFIGNVPQAYTYIFTKVFTTVGIYEVKLEGTDLCGTPCVITKNITICSGVKPLCNFSVSKVT